MTRALIAFTLLGMTSAYPAAEQCHIVDGRKDRQACYDRATVSAEMARKAAAESKAVGSVEQL